MSLPRDDLDLIDALVYCGAISRTTAKEVVATAKPGRVATCIMERGLNNACGPCYVIVERLAKAEGQAFGKVARSVRPEVAIPDDDTVTINVRMWPAEDVTLTPVNDEPEQPETD